jgi:anti-anti-sigma regulatory factor
MTSGIILELPSNLTIANIHPVHEQFEGVVNDKGSDHVTLKANAVERADTAGIQLIYAFVVAAKERQISIEWQAPSEKFCSAVELLGMKKSLDLN